ncbi:MAG: hypothetical protein M1418_04160 [Deltaproteobacteria bacterium]|nr:hypothetical protein [Deltaproteobacteria bacterium]
MVRRDMIVMSIREVKRLKAVHSAISAPYNERFGVCPANEADVHVKLPRQVGLDEYLCIKTVRTIRNDNTIVLGGRLYQLEQRGGKQVVPKTDTRVFNRPPKPAKDHPWNRRWQIPNAPLRQRTYAH